MKRSEMVTYLHNLLSTYENCALDITAADEILEGLENMGMLPPPIKVIEGIELDANYLKFTDWEKE